MPCYVMIDCNRIQQYVFSSSRLKGICNASYLLSYLEQTIIPSLIKDDNLIRSNGGVVIAEFSDEAQANAFISKASACYSNIGIKTTAIKESIAFDNGTSFFETVLNPLFKKMQIEKEQPVAPETKVSTTLAIPCEGIGQEVSEFVINTPDGDIKRVCRYEANKIKGITDIVKAEFGYQDKLRQWLDEYGTPHDFGDLVTWGAKSNLADKSSGTSEGRLMAVLYADVNSLGKILKNISNNKQRFIQFSKDIHNAINGSLYEALNSVITPIIDEHKKNNKPIKCLPLNVLYVGGDDLALVVKAQYAFEIAIKLVKTFEDMTKAIMGNLKSEIPNLPDKLTISIGMVFCPYDYPIRWTNNIGKSLQGNSKSVGKQKGGYPSESLIDFLFIKNNVCGSLSELRRPMIVENAMGEGYYLYLYGGPYSVDKIETLIKCTKSLLKSKGTKLSIPMSKLKALLSIMGKQSAERDLEFRDWLSNLSKEQKDVYTSILKEFKIDREDKQPITQNLYGDFASPIGDLIEMIRIVKSRGL